MDEKHQNTDSLWTLCMWELIPQKKAQGATELNFLDIDALVLKKATLPLPELLKFLGHNAADNAGRSPRVDPLVGPTEV